MSALVNQIKKIFDLGLESEDGFDIYDEIGEEVQEEPKKREKELKVVRPITGRGYEVMVVEPKSFDDALSIAKNLIERKTVVLNVEMLDSEQSQRVVDFLAGATHALEGHQQRIGDGVFIFTPNNVNISAEKAREKSLTDAFWNPAKG
ncbi:MAG: cell division protein SepF [Candidatus Gastranaerophilales bacterium]|nr:cell division protein SepF [Candidatus Gastranaerophilales bacterium]